MTCDIIIPTCKSLDDVSPMICDMEGFSRGHNIIATCTNGSASQNRNIGLEKATSEYVIMVDDDISGFYDGWIEDLLEPLADTNVIISSAHLVNIDGSDGNMLVRGNRNEMFTAVPVVPTAAIAFRKTHIRFDEGFKGSGYEDNWFCLQMQENDLEGAIIIANKCKLVHANEMKNQTGKTAETNEAHLKKLVKKHNLDWLLIRPMKPFTVFKNIEPYHSEHSQDEWLNTNIFKNKRNGVFVEVGAIDGLITSNSLFFERSLRWTGLLVEANPSMESAIKQNRPKCKIEMVAVSDKNGKATFLTCKNVTGWSGLEHSIESQHKDRIKEHHREGQTESVEVITAPLASVLIKHNMSKIDYLSLDIEGAEYDALKSFPFDQFDIDVFDIENNYGNDRVQKIMEANNYRKIKRLGVNDIYKKETAQSFTCDIIIANYNTKQLLNNCLESIFKHTGLVNINVIVVDNGSMDGSVEYLKTLSNVTTIYNKNNMGFGYANNQGLLTANSKYVCFLNSDTIVTENWLERMIILLKSETATMVSCMTDYVFLPSQKIETNGKDIDQSSKELYEKVGNKFKETERLMGFCLVADRDAIRSIGDCFDTRFEKGNFEDDDLSYRLRARKYKIGVAKGVFIQHVGGQTFNHLKSDNAQNIFERNKKLFENKWAAERTTFFSRDPLSIVYVLESNLACGGVKVIFEHANRLHQRGHSVKLLIKNKLSKDDWFNLLVPVVYGDISTIPDCDVAIATLYTTTPIVAKSNAKVKIHLSQGYEGLYQEAEVVRDSYRMIQNKMCVSSWLAEIIKEKTGESATVVSNGLDQYVYSFSAHQMKEQKPRVLVVGEKLEIKGIDRILEAIKPLTDKFTLVRMSSERESLCESYKMPEMTQQEIADVYSSCDILISGSQQVEGFGLPPLEAMASGCAVLTTDNGGNRDYIKNGKNCIVFTYGDAAGLVSALSLLLDKKELRDKYAAEGLKTALEFKWDVVIDRIEDYFLSCLRDR